LEVLTVQHTSLAISDLSSKFKGVDQLIPLTRPSRAPVDVTRQAKGERSQKLAGRRRNRSLRSFSDLCLPRHVSRDQRYQYCREAVPIIFGRDPFTRFVSLSPYCTAVVWIWLISSHRLALLQSPIKNGLCLLVIEVGLSSVGLSTNACSLRTPNFQYHLWQLL